MKAKVLRQFQDKYTREIMHVGDEIEVTEERFAEIQSKVKPGANDIIEEVKEENVDPDEGKVPDGTNANVASSDETLTAPAEVKVDSLKLEELRALAKEMGLDESGKRAELIERISKKMAEEKDAESED